MTFAVRFNNVTKQYGDTLALDNLSFGIPEGSIYGLVGRNGAGKTTAIRILLGLARATTGSVSVFDGDRSRRVGYLPDVPALYNWMSGAEYLHLMAGLANVSEPIQRQRIPELLALAGLGDGRDRISNYSLGMRQQLGLTQALVGEPELLILDEPTSALDPQGQREVHHLIANLRGHTTVLISSHFMEDVEGIADTIGILERGRLVTEGSMDQLRDHVQLSASIEVELTNNTEQIRDTLLREPWVVAVEQRENVLRVQVTSNDIGWRKIPPIVSEHDSGIIRFDAHLPNLEDIFIELAKEDQ